MTRRGVLGPAMSDDSDHLWTEDDRLTSLYRIRQGLFHSGFSMRAKSAGDLCVGSACHFENPTFSLRHIRESTYTLDPLMQ